MGARPGAGRGGALSEVPGGAAAASPPRVGGRAGAGVAWLLALTVLAAYAFGHARLPAVPGNSAASPQGWLTWADQGEYHRSARAFAQGDLDARLHTYPFAYPLAGAAFARAFPRHPFVVVDAACLVAFTLLVFLALRSCLPLPLAGIAALSGTILPPVLLEQWVVPWTSSLSASLLALALLASHRAREALVAGGPGGVRPVAWCIVLGAATGLVVSTRPVDVVAAVVPGILLAGAIAREALVTRRLGRGRAVRLLLAAAAPAAAGAGAFLLFNLAVYGDPVSPYLAYNSRVNGFSFPDLPEKAVSLLVDPGALYLADGMSFLRRAPLLVVGLCLVPGTLAAGPPVLRAACLMVTVSFAVYFSYADLLPQTLFRFGGMHYFKWSAPLLAGVLLWNLRDLAALARVDRRAAALRLAPPALLLLLLLSLRIETEEVAPARVVARRAALTVTLAKPRDVDYVDLVGVTPEALGASWQELYHDAVTAVSAVSGREVRELRYARGMRLLAGADRVRVLLVDTVRARRLNIRFDPRYRGEALRGAAIVVGTKRYALGWSRRGGSHAGSAASARRGRAASFAESTRSPSGHAIARSGSSQRTPQSPPGS